MYEKSNYLYTHTLKAIHRKQEKLYMNRHQKCIAHLARNEALPLAEAETKYRRMRSDRRVAIWKEILRHERRNNQKV